MDLQSKKKRLLIPPHLLTNGVFSRDNIQDKTKDGYM